jgi:hypothetical protein
MKSKGLRAGKRWLRCKSSSCRRTRIETPTDVLPEGHRLRGVSSLIREDGSTALQWIKTASETEQREQVLERLMRDLPTTIPIREGSIEPPAGPLPDDLLACYPLGDPHVGMLAWAAEGGDDHDLKIAESLLIGAMRHLAAQGPKAKHALIANLGDFFHADNLQGTTMRSGHKLDVDSRWAKVLRVGINIKIALIDEALRHHDDVRVICEIGNHDDHSSVFLAIALECHYRNEPRVSIDTSPSHFHYHRFGKNLIGTTHGNTVKHAELESVMASERPTDWGETKHRMWLCGHIHTSRRWEYRGCTVETFRTLAARDAYTAEHGYRSGRDAHRIVLHREHGEVSRTVANVDLIRSLPEHQPLPAASSRAA